MPNDPKASKHNQYDYEVDFAPLNAYLYPWRKQAITHKKPDVSLQPSPSTPFEDMFIGKHPMASSATYEKRNKENKEYDLGEALLERFDGVVRLPDLDPKLVYQINERKALMISAYLAVSLPITALVFARIFTTSLVPLDPLFDCVVVLFMACALTNVGMLAQNHVDTATKKMTHIAYQSTSIELKDLSPKTDTSMPTVENGGLVI